MIQVPPQYASNLARHFRVESMIVGKKLSDLEDKTPAVQQIPLTTGIKHVTLT